MAALALALESMDDIVYDDDEKTEFKFSELSARAKEHARSQARNDALDHDWWDSVYDDADTIAALMGIEIKRKHRTTYGGSIVTTPQIWFSGFCSQGDGACFEGNWYPAKDPLASLSAVIDHAPLDERLHEIAFDLAELSERCLSFDAAQDVSVHVEHRGNYYHSSYTHMDVNDLPEELDDGNELQQLVYATLLRKHRLDFDTFQPDIRNALCAFMDWIYRQLEAEHDYLTSDQCIDQYLADLTFDEDGEEIQ